MANVKGSVKTVTTKPALVEIETGVEIPAPMTDEELFGLKPSQKALLPPTPPASQDTPLINDELPQVDVDEAAVKQATLDKQLPKNKFEPDEGWFDYSQPSQRKCSVKDHFLLQRMRHPSNKEDVIYCWSNTIYERHWYKAWVVTDTGGTPRAVLKGFTGIKDLKGKYVHTAKPGEGKILDHDEIIGYAATKAEAYALVSADAQKINDEWKQTSEIIQPGEPSLKEVILGSDCLDSKDTVKVSKETAEQHKKNTILKCLSSVLSALGLDAPIAEAKNSIDNTMNTAKDGFKSALETCIGEDYSDTALQLIDSANEMGVDISEEIVKGAYNSLKAGKLPTFDTCMANAKPSLLPDKLQMGKDMLNKDGLVNFQVNDPKFTEMVQGVQTSTGLTADKMFKVALKDDDSVLVENLKSICKLADNKTLQSMTGAPVGDNLKMFGAAGKLIFGKSGTEKQYALDTNKVNKGWSDKLFVPPDEYIGPTEPLDNHMQGVGRPTDNLNFGGPGDWQSDTELTA